MGAIVSEIGEKTLHRFETIGLLSIPIMAVIALAGLVVVAYQASFRSPAEQSVLHAVRPLRGRGWKRPEHHLDDYIALSILIAKELARLHNDQAWHRQLWFHRP